MRMWSVLLLCSLVFGARLASAADNESVWATFEEEGDLKLWEGGDSGQVKVTIDNRDRTDRNKSLKVEALGGQYPGIASFKMPKDWSKYEVFSFEVWSNSGYGLGIRIDDLDSKNYKTRYNGGATLEKGRNLIQIPIKELDQVLDMTKIKAVILFTVDSPKGFTLHYDNFRLGPRLTDKVDFIPYDQRIEPAVTTAVESAHFPLAKPTAGGPLNVLSVYGVEDGRDLAELMERVDMKVSPVLWGREDGINKWIGLKYGDRSYQLCQRYLASSTQGPEKFDSMILGTPNGWLAFGKGATEAIIDRVKTKGEGLVLCFPFPGGGSKHAWPDDLKELSPLINSETDFMRDNGYMHYADNGRGPSKKWKIVKDHPITQGLQAAIDALPVEAIELQNYEVGPDSEVLIETEDGHPVLAVKTVGKGRVAAFGWRSHSLAPHLNPPADKRLWAEYRFNEVFNDLMARAALWTAGRDMKREGEPVTLTNPKYPDPNLSLKQWKNAKGEVTAWELGFTPPVWKPIAVTAPQFIKTGGSLALSWTLPADLPAGAEITLNLVDYAANRRRTMLQKTLTADDKEMTIPTEKLEQLAIFTEIIAMKDGVKVGFGQAVTYVTPSMEWKDYEVYGWPTGGIPYLRDLQMAQLRAFGLTTEQVGRREASKSFEYGFRVQAMMGNTGMHAKDFDARYREYSRTGDKKLLIRDPSFADPAFRADLKRRQQAWYKDLLPFMPLTVSVGDETSLTSYTSVFDYDMHPANIKAFQTKLEKRFGDIGTLNKVLGETFAGFDAIEPPLTADAKKAGKWGLWSLWRDHNDDLWAGAFQFLADSMKEIEPQARLSVSGTQTYGPFNGVDWAKLSPALGATADYTGRYQLVKRLSFNPDIRSTPWAGYGREGRAADYQLWTNLSFDGDGSAFFWYPSLLNPDFAFSESAKSYMRALKDLRAGVGMEFQRAHRQFSPVALLWSPRSQRAAWMLDKEPEFTKAEQTVYDRLVAAGYDPYFISEEQLVAGVGKAKGLKVLVLPMTISMGLGGPGGVPTLKALTDLTAGGGTVFATHPVQYNEFLQAPEQVGLLKAFPAFPADADALQAALEAAGIKPYANIRTAEGKRIGGVNTSLQTLVDGQGKPTGGKLLTILRAPVGQKEVVGADGVVYMEKDPSGGAAIEKLTVELGATGTGMQVVDMRSHTAVAVQDGKFTVDMQDGDGRPFALVPYGAVKLNLTAERAADGLTVTLAITQPDGRPATQPHVVRLEVIDQATGNPDPLLGRNLWVPDGGKLTYRLPLAVEETGKQFKVRVQDMLTTAREEK